jgi:hypothetical protein
VRERMCMAQETMLETELNIHVSRCVCSESKFYFDLVYKERCENCAHLIPVVDDKVFESLKDDVYIELVERTDKEIADYFNTCKKCDHYVEGICTAMKCKCPVPVQDLMRNPDTHCELGLW